jgi:hypothetical protein
VTNPQLFKQEEHVTGRFPMCELVLGIGGVTMATQIHDDQSMAL